MAGDWAARVCEDPEIVEESSVAKNESKTKEGGFTIVDESTRAPNRYRNRIFGCCSKRTDVDENIPPAASQTLYHDGSGFTTNETPRTFPQEMRHFLNSPVYCIFIIVVTFLTTVVLLMEVTIETGLFQAGETESETNISGSENSIVTVSTALHWFSFALLAVFFVEIILRVVVFRLSLLKDCISVIDVVVVLIAFLSDLCVTLVAGAENPIDGISLIIILRLVRIHSLVQVKVEAVKKRQDIQITEFEHELHVATCKITGLQRQVREKDFEIKQLQEYLGGNELIADHQFLHASKASLSDPKGATADSDLLMAIALSKQSFMEKSGGVVNRAFTHSAGNDLPILVHERPNRHSSQDSDIEPVPKVTSYMEEYFSKGIDDDKLSSDPSKGAIPKKKSTDSSLKANSNENNSSKDSYNFDAALKVLQADDLVKQPITISIDPAILQCDVPAATEVESADEPRSTFSSPASDIGSSDECVMDILPQGQKQPKSQTDMLKSWAEISGSSVSSESGYLSEDGNGKKDFTISATNVKSCVTDEARESSAM